jgi:hypothetical protein
MPINLAKTKIAEAVALWNPVKSWKTALDANQQALTDVFRTPDATEFAELYTYASANEAGITAIQTRISQPWVTGGCIVGGEGALVTEWGAKVERLKALMDTVTGGGTGGTPETVGTGMEKVVVIWGGGPGQPFQQGVQPQQAPVQGQAPAATTPASSTAADDAKKKETTKNLLIGGGILAALGTGIWALVRK